MVKTTFPVMDEVIWLQSMAEFVHQDYVKLIGNGGALKYSCALRPMPTLNMGFITVFLSASLSTCLK